MLHKSLEISYFDNMGNNILIFYALDDKTKCYPHMKQLLKYRMRDDEKQLLKFPKIRRNFTEYGMEF